MKICDPTCGSGGMLIESRKYVERNGGNPRNLVLEGQESNYGNLAMCKMNMVFHNIVDFKIEYGDILTNPKLVEGGQLKKYDRVLANFPFSMDWDNKQAAKIHIIDSDLEFLQVKTRPILHLFNICIHL